MTTEQNRKRVVPEQMIAVFKELGLEPKSGHLFKGDGDGKIVSCCGLGAYVIANHPERSLDINSYPSDHEEIYASLNQELGDEYVRRYWITFDDLLSLGEAFDNPSEALSDAQTLALMLKSKLD